MLMRYTVLEYVKCRLYPRNRYSLVIFPFLGEKHAPSRGTEARLDIDETGDVKVEPDQWGASKIAADGNDITVLVSSPMALLRQVKK